MASFSTPFSAVPSRYGPGAYPQQPRHRTQRQLDDNARAALGGKELLLILDGTEEADHLTRLLSLAPSCGLLITSRKKEDVFDIGYPVKRLDIDDAEAVLAGWAAGQAGDDRQSREICELVGNLPLAIRLAGRYMATRGLMAGEYLDWLQETGLEALDFGNRREESVRVLMARSVAQVAEEARQALAVTGVLALAPFRVEPVAAALKKTIMATRADLGALVNYGLLERPDTGYVVSHPLVHTFASRVMALEKGQLLQLAAYYNTFTREEREQGREGFARLDDERAHIMRVISVCEQNEAWEAVDRLVWAVGDYLDRQGHAAERIAALQAGVHAARETGNQSGEGAHLGNLGSTYAGLGEGDRAIDFYQQALAIAQEISDRRGEGDHLGNLGSAYYRLGEVNKAIDFYQQALAIAREIGDRRGEGNHLGNLGNTYRILGEVDKAIDFYQQALTISREIGNRRGEEADLGNLGNAYQNRGEVEKAIDFYQQALTIAREIGDRRGEGVGLGNLGNAYRNRGDMERAINFCQQALTIAQEIGDRRGEGHHLGNLGLAYRNRGEVEKAIDFYQQALTIAREIGDRSGEGNRLGNLGLAHADLGDMEKAIDFCQQALTISREIGDRRGEGADLGNLGNTYADLGEVNKAIDFYQQALTIAREIGDRSGEGNRLGYLGNAHAELGQVERARAYLQGALAIFEEIKDPRAEQVRNALEDLETSNMQH